MLNISTTPSNKANFLEILGSAILYLLKSFRYILRGEIQKEQLVSRLMFLGYDSILMVVALCSLASMILTYNTAIELTKHGGRELVGALVALANLREIIPTFVGFAIAARCGTTLSAEISTMKVTEQIDALKVLRIDPVYFLLAPTVLAIILLSPIILSIAAMVSMFAGMFIAKLVVNLEFAEFLESAWGNLALKDYFYPLIKVEVFCLYALLINITMGLNCSGGAKEVGLTTTKATALVIVGIVILDGFLTTLLFIE